MTQEALKLALEAHRKNESHRTVAETRYWCDQYKLLAQQAIEALAQPEEERIGFAGRERIVMTALLRLRAVIERTGFPRTTIYEKIDNGLFPRQIKIGSRAVAWPAHEIEALNAARLAGQTESQIRELVRAMEAQRKTHGIHPT